MYLKSLEMQGFKSFPDKTKLEFGKGMTAVVGPNGSGKSNIADAVKWVLGEQSTKSLRGSKMEDVVFSGTKTRRAQGFAEVTLRLDNKDRRLPRESDEVAVTRRFYRSGESEYKINGESVRLRDIHELFMDTGLGRDGYSMVSQGRIEDMVSAKSEDRREMFEEAAGISHYRYRRADAEKRLAAAEENLLRLRDILSSLEERVGPLEKQSKKAQEFLVLADERKNLEIGIWLDTLEKSAELIREQSNKYTVAQAHYSRVESEIEKTVAAEEEAAQEIREINAQIDETRRAVRQKEEEISSLKSLIAVNENSTEHNLETLERLEREREQENESSAKIDEEVHLSEQSAEKIRLSVKEKNEKITALASSIEELNSKETSASDEYSRISERITLLTQNAADENIKYTSAASSLEEIEKRRLSVDEEIENKNREAENLKKELEICEKREKELSDKISVFTNAVSGYMIKVQSKAQKLDGQSLKINKATLDLEQKKSQVRMLLDMEKNMEGYQGSVRAVIKASSNGALSGICGTVSQLISVPDEYSLAVETALGAAIQNIVTENESDAKKAIYFLKNSNSGRATFLPMTTVKGRELEEKNLFSCPGFINIASRIVEYDSKYDNIIQSLLGRTVIADNIDAAVRMGQKYSHKFKIVTLDGQVINAGGSMTGGSKIHNSGFLSRANKIEKLNAEIDEDTAALEKEKEEYKRVKEDYSADNASLEGAKGDLMRAQEEKLKAESAVTVAKSRLSAAESSLLALNNENLSASERTDYFKGIMEQAQNNAGEIENEINELREKINEISDSRRDLSDEREKINAQITEIKLQIAASERDIENINEHIISLKNRKDDEGGRISRIDGEIREIKEKNEKLRERIGELKAHNERFDIETAKLNEETNSLIEKRDSAEKRSNELRSEERSRTDEREKLSAELVRLDERKNALIKERDETQQKLFDEYKLTLREAVEMNIELGSVPEAKRRLAELKSKIKALGNVNVAAIDEYKEVSERYGFMKEQLDDVEKSKAELTKMIYSLTDKMAVQFREKFNIINENFKKTFSELFGGGGAELILEDENDILECGIEIKAQPPGKNVKSMTLLSGGEKGLCAIALLFAMLKVTPAPFCIFDEVEAALDDVNVLRYARYLKGMTDKIQFILITHRRGTMEEADILYGVTMQEQGVSKLLELKTAQMAHDLGLE